MAECTFSPNLTARSIYRQSSKAPFALELADDSEEEYAGGLAARSVKALTGGKRMYAEAVQTRREWLQHLQKLQEVCPLMLLCYESKSLSFHHLVILNMCFMELFQNVVQLVHRFQLRGVTACLEWYGRGMICCTDKMTGCLRRGKRL